MKKPALIWLVSLSLAILSFAFVVPVFGERVLQRLDWSDHAAHDPGLSGGVVVPSGNDWKALRVSSDSAEGAVLPIARLTDLDLTEAQYALVGDVRHEEVEGTGYLEMWSVFADGSRYFSRTQAPAGPLQSFQGSSEWRAYTLPFYLGESPLRPDVIEVNVVLPARGTVELGPISLIEFSQGEDAIAESTGAWWTDRMAGLVGGIGGSLVGLLGALIGILAGLGRARGLVTALVILIAAVGIAALVAGAVAFFGGQPYGVYYPLALGGILSAVLGLMALVVLPRRYATIELRRMDALDAR
ncbi:MAG: hypothetical protein OES47_13165 [Acidobacteriota bacterium]|nr:hypothetical protein [Acidobacteriota bacterium]